MDTRIALSMPDDLIAAVDEWRRYQPDIPGRSEALRRLIEHGLLNERHLGVITNLLGVLREAADRGALTQQEIDQVSASLHRHLEAVYDVGPDGEELWPREELWPSDKDDNPNQSPPSLPSR